MTTFFKGLHLTIDGWRSDRDEEGWKTATDHIRRKEPGDCKNLSHDYPKSVKAVPRLKNDVRALMEMTKAEKPPVIVINTPKLYIAKYGFGDASGGGFGTILEEDGKIEVLAGTWNEKGSKKSSNFRELSNFVIRLEVEAAEGKLFGSELFFFTDNDAAQNCYHNGTSSSKLLFDLIVRLKKLELNFGLRLHIIHVSGKRMINQGTDGVSRGNMMEGVLTGRKMLTYIPIHLSAIERSNKLLTWVRTWCGNESLTPLSPTDWLWRGQGLGKSVWTNCDGLQFPVRSKEKVFLWSPPPCVADVAIEYLRESIHKRSDAVHIIIIPKLMTYAWRKTLLKMCDCSFYIDAGHDCWPECMYESLLIGVYLPLLNCFPWTLRKSGSVLELERLLSVLPCTEERSKGTLLRKFLLLTRRLQTLPEWCGKCYVRKDCDKFRINEPKDEDGLPMFEDEEDEQRYKVGCDGAQFLIPFQCDLCIFRSLFKRDPRQGPSDLEALEVIRRMNLDIIWSREPSTIAKNLWNINNVIATCEASGFTATLPALGPLPFEDIYGWSVAFTMIIHSTRGGRNAKGYTQFATIRKNRSAFSNLYAISAAGIREVEVISMRSEPAAAITACPTNSIWFLRWASGCETRMGYVEKKNKAISIELFFTLMQNFKKSIKITPQNSWARFRLISGMTYSVLSFAGSFRGSETLKLDWSRLVKYLEKGNVVQKGSKQKGRLALSADSIPHIIIPLQGRFKGEKGERCHLIPMANTTKTGIPIRAVVELFVEARKARKIDTLCNWSFVNQGGRKMEFREMNEIILEMIEEIKDKDETDKFGLKEITVREDFSINRSFRRGSTAHALNQKIPQLVVEAHNRWRKIERSKGRKPKLGMI